MNYDDVITKIHSFTNRGINPGLERIKKLMCAMGNPQDKLKYVHVAGTNGKGSICTLISSVMKESGYKTGLFISPSVIDFRERIQINGEMISKNELINTAEKVFKILEKSEMKNLLVTEFELVTAIAFEYFYQSKCDIVVLETGLGGRLDATNIIKNPLECVITSVSLDHTNILGDTIEKIALEKCGIIKNDSVVISYPKQDLYAMKIIENTSREKQCELLVPNDNMLKIINNENISYTEFEYKNYRLKTPFIGNHQLYNAITAVEAIEKLMENYRITTKSLQKGFEKAYIPARLEVLSKNPYILLDGAHNPSGAMALSDALKRYFSGKKIICVVGMLKDKDVDKCLSLVLPLTEKVITLKVNNSRSMSTEDITIACKKYCENVECSNDICDAIKRAQNYLNDSNDMILIFGSLYLAGEVKNIFNLCLI